MALYICCNIAMFKEEVAMCTGGVWVVSCVLLITNITTQTIQGIVEVGYTVT